MSSCVAPNDFDVIIIGAGLSGVGAARDLQQNCPAKRYVILEGRASLGGTWDLFRFPGIRSDSDVFTFSYNFKPWNGNAGRIFADGQSIYDYIKETAEENGIDEHIRFKHSAKRASWSSESAAWTVQAERWENDAGETTSGTDAGAAAVETVTFRCNFLLVCCGYYDYENGYTPDFKGREHFRGRIVHPQKWPDDLDYRGQKIVVIGSGATAVTLVPALTKEAEHVMMLQRSPSYVASLPSMDAFATFLRTKLFLPEKIVFHIMRWKYIVRSQFLYDQTRTNPEKMKKLLIDLVRKELGPDYDVETHFTPKYNPWDQRLCLVPDGDLFDALKSGKASMVTDHIETFTENGILLRSGRALEADIIVTATGLNLLVNGGVQVTVDDKPVDFSNTYTYKGLMYSDVPNLISAFGYVNASWNLHADLTSEYACRILNHMDKKGYKQCVPRWMPSSTDAEESEEQVQKHNGDKNGVMPSSRRPYLEDFTSGYMQRGLHLFPMQGDDDPWTNPQNYGLSKRMIRSRSLEDGILSFK